MSACSELDDPLSTLSDYPATVRLKAVMPLPWDWLEGEMGETNKWRGPIGGLCVVGGAIGGALLFNHFAPGSTLGVSFGFVAGAVVGLVAFGADRVRSFSVGGGTAQLEVHLEAIAKSADEAKKLAQLSVEMAMILANRPTGVVGGGSLGRNDGFRRLIAERLTEMGFEKQDGSSFARFDDPHIARRILTHMVLRAVRESEAGGAQLGDALAAQLLGRNGEREPAAIERLLGADLMSDPNVATAMRFYRDWHTSDAKLYFVVENLDTLKESGSKSESDIR